MPRLGEIQIAADRDLGRAGAEALGQGRAGEDEVERAEALDEPRQGRQGRPHGVGERGEHAQLLVALLEAETGQLVVERDRLLGLDEDRHSALRAVVDDAAHGAPGVVPDGHHVAAVPHGDVALLERGRDGRVIEKPLDAGLEIRSERRDLPTQRAQPGARAVRHPAVGIERLAERPRELRADVSRYGTFGGFRVISAP